VAAEGGTIQTIAYFGLPITVSSSDLSNGESAINDS